MDRYDNMRNALEVMTAWTDDPNSAGFPIQRIDELILSGTTNHAGLIAGFVNLTGYLLTMRARDIGTSEVHTLQEIARDINHDGS